MYMKVTIPCWHPQTGSEEYIQFLTLLPDPGCLPGTVDTGHSILLYIVTFTHMNFKAQATLSLQIGTTVTCPMAYHCGLNQRGVRPIHCTIPHLYCISVIMCIFLVCSNLSVAPIHFATLMLSNKVKKNLYTMSFIYTIYVTIVLWV